MMSPEKKARELAKLLGVPLEVIKKDSLYQNHKTAFLEWKKSNPERRRRSKNFNVYTNDPNCRSCRKKRKV